MQKIIGLLVLILVVSCARVSFPEGGKKDTVPPKFISSSPKSLSVNVDPSIKEIVLNFDEYVIVKDPAKQVIISPPLKVTPVIQPTSAARKNIYIRFYESLKENTTYTINFGSGIQDNNEGNKLEDFLFTFSTGPKIDSLQVAGKVNMSLESKQVPILAALYKIEGDTIDLKNKPYYIARTDPKGNFLLQHLNEGRYRLIAFKDLNSNLTLDSEKEQAGFSIEIIDPRVANKTYNLIISPIKQKYKAVGVEQESQGIIKFKFKGNPESVSVKSLESDFPLFNTVHAAYADSLYLYFNDQTLKKNGKKERIKFLVKNQLKTDTLSILYDNDKTNPLLLSAVQDRDITPGVFFALQSNNYIEKINKDKIEVYKGKENLDFTTEIDSADTKKIKIKFPVVFNADYKVKIKPNAFEDFLGQKNEDSLFFDIKTKKQNDYGNLTIKLQNKPESPFFFQLLNNKNELVENIYSTKDIFEFKNMKPGKYFIRILVDENKNKFWDPVDIEKFIPAERTYLYPKEVEVRAFWDINETWVL